MTKVGPGERKNWRNGDRADSVDRVDRLEGRRGQSALRAILATDAFSQQFQVVCQNAVNEVIVNKLLFFFN
jgi:hypothetical protein